MDITGNAANGASAQAIHRFAHDETIANASKRRCGRGTGVSCMQASIEMHSNYNSETSK